MKLSPWLLFLLAIAALGLFVVGTIRGCRTPEVVARADSVLDSVKIDKVRERAQADTIAALKAVATRDSAARVAAIARGNAARRRADSLHAAILRLTAFHDSTAPLPEAATASDSAAYWKVTAWRVSEINGKLAEETTALREGDDHRLEAIAALTDEATRLRRVLILKDGQIAQLHERQDQLVASVTELKQAVHGCTLLHPCFRVTVGPGLALAKDSSGYKVQAHAVQVNAGLSFSL